MADNDINNIFGEINLDLSLQNDFNKEVSTGEYKDNILDNIQTILNERFPGIPGKRQISTHIDRISFACPYCGDSMRSDYKKRGNVILKGKHANFYKCHNCGMFKRVDNFLKDFKINMDLGSIKYMSNHIGDFNNNLSYKYDMSLYMDIDFIEKYAIDRDFLKSKFGLVEINESINIKVWLNKRLQYDYNKFLYNPEKNYLLVLNLTPSGKIMGVQKRLFKGANKYITYKLSKLYEFCKISLEIEDDDKEFLDTLSMIFNILLIDINKPITGFEGAMDALLFKNAISISGAVKEMPIEMPVRYVYDYDTTGKKLSVDTINKGIEIFLWGKFLRDINAPYRKKWDWNDIVIYSKNNNIILPSPNEYFSSDSLDLLDF